MASTARFTTSGLRGVENAVGSVVLVVDFPLRLKILAVLGCGMLGSSVIFLGAIRVRCG
jgi:hypothetical protein